MKKDNIGYLPTIDAQGLSALQMSSNVIVLGFANVFLVCMLSLDVIVSARGRGYCHIWVILVCAAVKGMVFKQFTLGYVI